MPAEEHNQMHAPEANNDKTKLSERGAPACVYPLETLVALQKMLENGIPEPGERLPRSTPRTAPVTESNHQNIRNQLVPRVTGSRSAWQEYLHRIFLKLKRSREAGKGHSAQQNG